MSILSSSPTGIFRRKPVDEVEPEELEEGGGLQRVLGLWQLTAIGIGGIIGAGIFSLAGAVANEKAGPGVLCRFWSRASRARAPRCRTQSSRE
jgi:basic amino acid/polyamine antiporter, APA family